MADVPTTAWSETSPAGSDNISLGDNRIREMKTQIREVIDVDHDFPSSGKAADVGQHKQVTLQEQADLGTGAEGVPILGAQTVDGNAELVFTTEGDADIQFTKGDYPYYSAPENVAGMAGLLNLIYPVGSIYANASDSTNPGTLFGVGTWVAIEEEVIAGYKAGGTFGSLGSLASGAETVTLTAAQSGVPAHTHTVNILKNATDFGVNFAASNNNSGTGNWNVTSAANSAANASEAHNNIQPTYVAYLWRRTA